MDGFDWAIAAILVVAFGMLGFGVYQEVKHPCLEYGREVQDITYIPNGSGGLMPMFSSHRECLRRE